MDSGFLPKIKSGKTSTLEKPAHKYTSRVRPVPAIGRKSSYYDYEQVLEEDDDESDEKFQAKKIFRKFDPKNVGFIGLAEVKIIVTEELNISLRDEELHELASKVFSVMDGDYDKKIEEREFVKFYRHCLSSPDKKKDFFGRLYFDEEELRDSHKLFKKYSKKGKIGTRQIRKLLNDILEIQLSSEETEMLIERVLTHGVIGDKRKLNEKDFRRFQMKYMDQHKISRWAAEVHKEMVQKRELAASDALFEQYDQDGSGFIEKTELKKMIVQELQMELSASHLKSQVKRILAKVDRDGDNKISKMEFQKLFKKCFVSDDVKRGFFGHLFLSKEEKTAAKKLFRQFDADNSGTIKADELAAIVTNIGLPLRPEEQIDFVNHVISVGDRSGDGCLGKEEFFRFFRKCLITKEKTELYKAKVLKRYLKQRKHTAIANITAATTAAITLQRAMRKWKQRMRMGDMFNGIHGFVRSCNLWTRVKVRVRSVKQRMREDKEKAERERKAAEEKGDGDGDGGDGDGDGDDEFDGDSDSDDFEEDEPTRYAPQLSVSKLKPEEKESDSEDDFEDEDEERTITEEQMDHLTPDEAIALFRDMGMDLPKHVVEANECEDEIDSLLMAAEEGNVVMLVRHILVTGLDINTRAEDGCTAMLQAVSYDNDLCVEALLKLKADANIVDNEGCCALHIAAFQGGDSAIAKLMQFGPQIGLEVAKKHPKSGATALYLAAQEGNLRAIRELTKCPNLCGLDEPSASGNTPLYVAAYEGYSEAVEVLLNAKANVHAQSQDGVTALLVAVQNGHVDCTRHLLKAKADPSVATGGAKPMSLAIFHGCQEIVECLLAHCDIGTMYPHLKAANADGQTAKDIESSPDISATFIGEFAILGVLCDKMEAEKLGFDMHTTLLDRIHGLTLEQARSIDAKAVVPETYEEIRQQGSKIFAKYSRNNEMTRKQLSKAMANMKLKKKYGNHFDALVSLMFVRSDLHGHGYLGGAEFVPNMRHLLFLQRCPTGKQLAKKSK